MDLRVSSWVSVSLIDFILACLDLNDPVTSFVRILFTGIVAFVLVIGFKLKFLTY